MNPEIFVPENRLRIWFYGVLAIDATMLLALISPLLAYHTRRLMRRLLHRASRPAASDDGAAAMVWPRRLANKAWFPLTMVTIWLALVFGNSQWCRLIYMYQAYVLPGEEPKPPHDYTGQWCQYDPFGQLAANGPVKDGKRHGTWRFNVPGQTREEDYGDGVLNGRVVIWDRNGTKAMEYQYRNGKTHGLCQDWDNLGRLFLEFTDVDGMHHGHYKRWRSDGTLLMDCTFRNGQPWDGVYGKDGHGDYEHYGPWIVVQDTYRDGIKDGPTRVFAEGFDEPDRVIAEGIRKGGRPWSGTILTFAGLECDHCNYWVRTYVDGRINGPAKWYAATGSVAISEDKRTPFGPDGHEMTPMAEGQLRAVVPSDDAHSTMFDGLWTFRDSMDEKVLLTCTFRDGQPWSGTVPRHRLNGRIIDQCKFEDGQPRDGIYFAPDHADKSLVVMQTFQAGRPVGAASRLPRHVAELPLYLQD